MAYTVPTTRATGNLITAAMWNTDLVENIKFLANPPACRVFHSVNQSIANNADAVLAFNSERFDTAAMHDTVTNNSRITIPVAGLYLCQLNVSWAPNATGARVAHIRVNGATIISSVVEQAASTGVATRQFTGCTYKFVAGDYIEAIVFQNSGGALNAETFGNLSPEFSATWVGIG